MVDCRCQTKITYSFQCIVGKIGHEISENKNVTNVSNSHLNLVELALNRSDFYIQMKWNDRRILVFQIVNISEY